MSATRFVVADGQVRAAALPLPRSHREGWISGESYRRRVRGEDPPLEPDYLPAVSVRSTVLGPGEPGPLLDPAAGLIIVVSGRIEVDTTSGTSTLRRGDALLVEGGPLPAGVRHAEGTRLVGLPLRHPWPESGPALEASAPEDDGTRAPELGAMRQAADDLSYFGALDTFFPSASGVWSEARPARGLFVVELADGCVIDMHPEVVTQLVLVLSGDIELEVSGDGEVRHYRAGDIVLAADRTGVGHIDRFHGTTTLAVAVMEEHDPW